MEISEHEYLNRKRLLQGLDINLTDSNEVKLLKLRAKLKIFRYYFIDDLPVNLVGLNDPMFPFYKCRGNFFEGVHAHLWQALDHKIIDDTQVVDDIREFMKYCKTLDLLGRITKENLDKVNEILDSVIEYTDSTLREL